MACRAKRAVKSPDCLGRRIARRDRRPDIAVAAARHRLNPIRPPQLRQKPGAMPQSEPSDCCPRSPAPAMLPRSVHPWKRGTRALQKQPKQRNRALAQHDRLGTAKQNFGVRVEPERAKFVDRRHRLSGPVRKHFATFSERFHDLRKCSGSCCNGPMRTMKRKPMEDIMSAKAVIRMPGEGKEVSLAGKPLVFLVTGQDTKHTSMFDWTLPAGFSTGTHVHRVQEETFYVLEGECEWHVGDQTGSRQARNICVHSAGRAAQHCQRQRQAGKDDHDRLAARSRTLLRRAGEAGDAEQPSRCQCHCEIAGSLRHRATVRAKSQLVIFDRRFSKASESAAAGPSMAALCGCPPWVRSRHLQCKRACPLCPRKRTCAVQLGMSALCQ